MLQKILDTAAEKSWQVTSINFDAFTMPAFLNSIQDLDSKKEHKIILDCELERLNSILNVVNVFHVFIYIGNGLGLLQLGRLRLCMVVGCNMKNLERSSWKLNFLIW